LKRLFCEDRHDEKISSSSSSSPVIILEVLRRAFFLVDPARLCELKAPARTGAGDGGAFSFSISVFSLNRSPCAGRSSESPGNSSSSELSGSSSVPGSGALLSKIGSGLGVRCAAASC
jgi:hypothetical protein